jgi:hypothetical protein
VSENFLQHWFMGILVAMHIFQGPSAPEGDAPVYLDGVIAPPDLVAGKPFDVEVGGNLPTPAYRLLEPSVSTAGHTVTIKLACKLEHKGPSIQMLQPFTKTVEIKGLKAGRWTIEAIAKGDQRVETVVQVK